jgi:hypothetical protein
MPPLPDVAKVLRIEYTFLLDEDINAKTRHFVRYSGSAPTNAQLDTFCDDIATAFTAHLDDNMATTYSVKGIKATDLSSSTAALGENTDELPGTRSGAIVSAAACVVISRRVARRFRGGHSRMYWPFGVAGDLHDAQTWGDVFIAGVQSDWDAFSTDLFAAGWSGAGSLDGVAVSYYEGFTVFTGTTGRARNISTPRVTPLVDTLTSDVVRTGIGSQRGRLLHLA